MWGVVLLCLLLDEALADEAEISVDATAHLSSISVFVVHYTPNVERKVALQSQLAREGITAKWIETFDREELSSEIIDQNYDQWRFVLEDLPPDVDPNPQIHITHRMQESHISLALKHVEAYRQIVQAKLPVALILEDDAEIKRGFQRQLQQYFEQLPQDWDMICLGEGNPPAPVPPERRRPGIHVYRSIWDGTGMSQVHSNNIFRSSDAYAVTLGCAQKLLDAIVPFAFPIDNQLCYTLNALKVNVYWAHPELVVQGTVHGKYESTIVGGSNEGTAEDRIGTFSHAIKLRPDHPRVDALYTALGEALADASTDAPASRRAEAASAFQHAITAHPGNSDAAYGLGTMLLNEQRYAEAAHHLEHASSANPADYDRHERVAFALYKSRTRGEEALEHAKLAVSLSPEPNSISVAAKIVKAVAGMGKGNRVKGKQSDGKKKKKKRRVVMM